MSKIYERNEIGAKTSSGTGGDVGPPGPPNVLTVGTVETLAPGEDAVVTITGESPNQVINFSIPQGEPGDAAGVSIPAFGAPGYTAMLYHQNNTRWDGPGSKVAGSEFNWASINASDSVTLTELSVYGAPAITGTWVISGVAPKSDTAVGSVVVGTRIDDERSISRSLSRAGTVRACRHVGTEEVPAIDCEIMLNGEWVPFTASPNDPAPHGRKIYEAALAGQFGNVVLTPSESEEK